MTERDELKTLALYDPAPRLITAHLSPAVAVYMWDR